MRVIPLARKIGKNLTLLKPLLYRGFTLLQWLNHRRSNVLTTVQGIRYELDLNEVIDSSIYFFGVFEPESVSAVKRLVKPGDIVLDVGANIGCHALLFSKLVGPQGRVVAFEPTTWAFRKLRRNSELNLDFCSENLNLEKVAVGDRSATSQHVRFRSSWLLFGPNKPPEEDIVDFLTLDEYVKKKGLERVDFIKVDVDGYEYKVIKGAFRTLQQHKPLLMLEFWNNTLAGVGDRLEDLVDCLYSLGYAIRWDKGLHLFRDRSEILATVPSDSTINVICVPESGREPTERPYNELAES